MQVSLRMCDTQRDGASAVVAWCNAHKNAPTVAETFVTAYKRFSTTLISLRKSNALCKTVLEKIGQEREGEGVPIGINKLFLPNVSFYSTLVPGASVLLRGLHDVVVQRCGNALDESIATLRSCYMQDWHLRLLPGCQNRLKTINEEILREPGLTGHSRVEPTCDMLLAQVASLSALTCDFDLKAPLKAAKDADAQGRLYLAVVCICGFTVARKALVEKQKMSKKEWLQNGQLVQRYVWDMNMWLSNPESPVCVPGALKKEFDDELLAASTE